MKRLILVAVAVCSILGSTYGQVVNGIKVENIPARYVDVVSTSKLLKPFQVTTYLSYGQISKLKDAWGGKGQLIDESTGAPMSFNGAMGLLNALEKKGFKFVDKYIVTSGSQNVYHFLLENTNYNK